jgi:hypothetical protein
VTRKLIAGGDGGDMLKGVGCGNSQRCSAKTSRGSCSGGNSFVSQLGPLPWMLMIEEDHLEKGPLLPFLSF